MLQLLFEPLLLMNSIVVILLLYGLSNFHIQRLQIIQNIVFLPNLKALVISLEI